MPFDQPPIPNTTWFSTSQSSVLDLHYHGQMAIISNDGGVRINWQRVEEWAADPKSDHQAWLYAKMLLAARDGTAQPLPDEAH
jgi:hypothetical protein